MLPTSAKCPITQAPIVHPGFLHCGHEFEKHSISSWLANGQSQCPICREVCTLGEISDTAQDAMQKAGRIAEGGLRAKEATEEVEHIKILESTTYAQALDRMLQASLKQITSNIRFTNDDGNRLYRIFLARVFCRFVLNLEPLKIPDIQNVAISTTSPTLLQKFNEDFKKVFVPHMVVSSSSLLLHALIEDTEMHELISPPAYKNLFPCKCPVSSQEIAREYMLCEQIQHLERDILLADSGIEAPNLTSGIMQSIYMSGMLPMAQFLNVFKILQTQVPASHISLPHVLKNMELTYPFWARRTMSHLKSEGLRGIELLDGARISLSPEGTQAFNRVEVEFLLSIILLRSLPNDSDRKECSLALEILEGLTEQTVCLRDGRKVNLCHRLYQILGDLLPALENESSEERGRSLFPLLFHTVHPKAILYTVAQLRSELHAQWQFTDQTDYEQQWNDLRNKMRRQGHL